jgi:uncharacterized delta-60 repeat protein
MSNVPEDGSRFHFDAGIFVGGGRFELVKHIGAGGIGTVWLAQDERLNERVALKFLSVEFRKDPTALSNLRKETQKSRKLSHRNILRIHDLYESPDEPAFISMEYVEGQDLAHLQRQQTNCIFTWEFLQPIVKQLCEALEYAHSEGLIHRDLKPSNMILDTKGKLKLADFGLAGLTTDPYAALRPKGYWAGGTLNYMSPQQIDGLPAGVADDVYALGATLYELLTSRAPFYNGDIAEQARETAATPITDRLEEFDLKNEIPRDVRALIMACLSKEPSQRPASARAVAEWIGLTDTTLLRRQDVPGADSQSTAVEAAIDSQPPARILNGRLITIAVAIVIALGAAFVWSKFGAQIVGSAKRHAADNLKPFRTIDTSFDPGTGANVEVRALAVQKDGKVIVGGRFTLFNQDRHVGFVRLNTDGTIDRKCTLQTDGVVWSMALQPDEKILIAGDFSNVNGEKHATIARLNPDLSVDNTFDCASGKKCDIRAIVSAKDKIFVGGPVMMFHQTRFDHIAELDTSGNPIESSARVNANVWALALQGDGKLIVGGEFERVAGVGRHPHLARLNPDGALDKDFAPDPNQRVYALALQSDDKILVGGSFDRIAGTQMHGIARVNADGSIDKTFNPGSGADGSVQSIAVQSDGQILIGGTFHEVDGARRDCIARLNPDGTVDQTFAPAGVSEVVRTVAVAPGGNILIGGSFTNIDGVQRRNVARLKATP